MEKGPICFFIQKHLEPFCFHTLKLLDYVIIVSNNKYSLCTLYIHEKVGNMEE